MIKRTEKFEDFLKTYIQNAKISENTQSYADWVIKNGIDASAVYDKRMLNAEAEKQISRAEYGSNAERLAAKGLTDSGYSSYINSIAERKAEEKKNEALSDRFEMTENNIDGYISDIATKKSDVYDKMFDIINRISKADLFDYDSAYSYAITAGLDEESAAEAARSGLILVRTRFKAAALDRIIDKRLTSVQAKEYAEALGLPPEDVKELAEYAKSINEYIDFD